MDRKDIEWKPIKGYEGLYEISNYGDIKILRNNTIKKQRLNYGYCYCGLSKNAVSKTYRVHKLVAEHFISEKPYHNSVVGHYDNNKSNNYYKNLYWTTTQENTRKAVDDDLLANKKGIENENSTPVKVISVETGEVVGVYGSARECSRYIENVTSSYISKVYDRDYKPRGKKYIYKKITKEEYFLNIHLAGTILIENKPSNKKPKIFTMERIEDGYTLTMDNQKEASRICGIDQSTISSLIKKNGEKDGWRFTLIKEVDDVKDSTSYNKFLEVYGRSVSVKNIFSEEVLHFKTIKEMKSFFGLTGNDQARYLSGKNLIKSEWKVI